jgi:hypothetical protein
MSSFTSYPKVWNVGHGAVKDIFLYPLLVEEKIDGSQFSFGLIEGRLRIKSHHQDISDIVGEYGLFTEAIAYVRELYAGGKLHPEWTYRCEVLQSPKHNKLAYERVPRHNMIGFDVCVGDEQYLEYTEKCIAFRKLDLEVVPYHYFGVINNPNTIDTLLDRVSILGGKLIEGIVFKAYGRFGEDKKTLMAKYVNPKFRELNPSAENQTKADFLTELIETYRSEARWDKAIQHLKEQGALLGEPKDIGPLIGEIVRDLKEEEGMGIMARLMRRYWPHIARGATGGFAEYYKRKLMEGAFAKDEDPAIGPVASGDAGSAPASLETGAVPIPQVCNSTGAEVPRFEGCDLPGVEPSGPG